MHRGRGAVHRRGEEKGREGEREGERDDEREVERERPARHSTHLEVEKYRDEGGVANLGDSSDGCLVRSRAAEDGRLGRWRRECTDGLFHEGAELYGIRLVVPVVSAVVRVGGSDEERIKINKIKMTTTQRQRERKNSVRERIMG